MAAEESLGINICQSDLIYYLEYGDKPRFGITDREIMDFIRSFYNSGIFPKLSYPDPIKTIFINYGRTQLVFVGCTNTSKYTMLVNQPGTPFGTGKKEFNNLTKLNSSNPDTVIEPKCYYSNGFSELYVTPYVYQSRCIGVEDKDWGVWVPEPNYHFREFAGLERKAINQVMLALLIKYYDEEKHLGISKCRLDGGDFMIAKGYEKHNTSVDFIMENIKLIAARELIQMDFQCYVQQLREELSGKITNKDDLKVLGRAIKTPFTEEEIEKGIALGYKLRGMKYDIDNKKLRKNGNV